MSRGIFLKKNQVFPFFLSHRPIPTSLKTIVPKLHIFFFFLFNCEKLNNIIILLKKKKIDSNKFYTQINVSRLIPVSAKLIFH